jgi:hypothetical protein
MEMPKMPSDNKFPGSDQVDEAVLGMNERKFHLNTDKTYPA